MLEFQPVFGANVITYDDAIYSGLMKDSIVIYKLKYYVTDLRFRNNGKIVFRSEKNVQLMDPENNTIKITTKKSLDFDEVIFNIGIDSSTNVSGALGGDLDPINGMYWTWQSGYINFKLEGRCNAVNSADHTFNYHIGGYQYPYNSCITIKLPVKNTNTIKVMMDIEKIFIHPEIMQTPNIMSPGKQAMNVANCLRTIFSIKE